MVRRIITGLKSIFTITPAVLTALLVLSPSVAHAYDPNDLISDQIFTNSNSMNPAAIQNFLNGQNSGLKNYSDVENCSPPTPTLPDPYASTYYPHCGTSQSAATIIYDAGQAYGINPQAIIATMQKEQSLITTPNPTASQINCAMGYNSCGGFSGFFNQVDNGTWALRTYIELMSGRSWWGYSPSSYPCKNGHDVDPNNNLYSTGLYPGRAVTFYDSGGTAETVTLANASTAALYCYTPYVGPYSVTGYSGSYNFVVSFEQWFGSTLYVVPPLSRDAGSPIAIAGNQDGTLQITGITDNDSIYTRRQSSANSNSWSAWSQITGALRNITAETNSGGAMQLVGVAVNGNVYTTSQTVASSTSWNAWTQLDGALNNAALARNYNGTLEIFGVANNGNVYYKHQTSNDSNNWGAWTQLPGGLKNITADTNADGRIQLIGVAGNGNIYSCSQTAVNTDTWSAWTQLDGGLAKATMARNYSNGNLEIFGVASNGNIYYRHQSSPNSSTWAGWSQMPGALKSVASEYNSDGRIQLVGVAGNGNIYTTSQTAVYTDTWSNWTQLDGALRKY